MIYSLKIFTSYFIDVDTFYLFLNWFSTRVSDHDEPQAVKFLSRNLIS